MKKLTAIVLAMLMLFALVACGGGEEVTTEPSTEATTEAPVAGEPITSEKGNVTVSAIGDWEFKGFYTPTMMEFTNKTIAAASIYISDEENMEYEVQKKSVTYAYPDKAFEELKIGDITYECLKTDAVAHVLAPTSNGYAIYVQVRGCTIEDATVLLETLEIK